MASLIFLRVSRLYAKNARYESMRPSLSLSLPPASCRIEFHFEIRDPMRHFKGLCTCVRNLPMRHRLFASRVQRLFLLKKKEKKKKLVFDKSNKNSRNRLGSNK